MEDSYWKELKFFFYSKNKQVRYLFASSILSWRFFFFLSVKTFGLP